jgi:hypothetical protein
MNTFFSKSNNLKFELNIYKRSKKVLTPFPNTPKTADMEKKGRYSDGPNI